MPRTPRQQKAHRLTHVDNSLRKFGADPEYWGQKIIWKGKTRKALFTEEAIEEALERGRKNPEDTRKI